MLLTETSVFFVARNSSVGVATRYGLDGPGIESRLGRDFPHPSRPPLGPTQPPIQWVPGLSRGVKRPGCDFDHHPQLAPRLKERAELCRAFMAFSRVNVIFYLTYHFYVSFPRLTTVPSRMYSRNPLMMGREDARNM